MENTDNEKKIHCPKCNSTQLTANKKGFSGTKAVGGALLTGGIGLLAGTIGSNKIRITCLKCGHVFKPGEGTDGNKTSVKKETITPFGYFLIALVWIIILYWILS